MTVAVSLMCSTACSMAYAVGVESQDNFVAWSADGRSIFVSPELEVPRTVYRINLATGKRAFWRVLAPADLVGVINT